MVIDYCSVTFVLTILVSSIVCDTRPMPPLNPDSKEDEALFEETDPFVDGPISVDHGLNFKVGKGTFLNFNLLVLDTCLITVGERVLFGPNVCLYGATHPMDPATRLGLKGPECGKEVHIEDDVWIGGSVIVLAGVRIGKGSTVGAGSVVTKVSILRYNISNSMLNGARLTSAGRSSLPLCRGQSRPSHSPD
jgi:acetyltransferase-like isoleucine patch superfamily enzyme